jgi:hypothetical protein
MNPRVRGDDVMMTTSYDDPSRIERSPAANIADLPGSGQKFHEGILLWPEPRVRQAIR